MKYHTHWRSKNAKLGDTIMMLSAMASVGNATWTFETKEVGRFWKELYPMYQRQIKIKPKFDPRGLATRTVFHADKTFPIIQPDSGLTHQPGNGYIVVHTQSAGDWRSVDIDSVPIDDWQGGFDVVCIDGRQDSMKDLYELIAGAELYVGVDSGPMWIAQSLKVPSVLLYTHTKDTRQAQNLRLLQAQDNLKEIYQC